MVYARVNNIKSEAMLAAKHVDTAAATLVERDGQAVWTWAGREIEGLPTGGDELMGLV